MSRRLAVILAADVVGYSLLMGEDERQALAALAELRDELFEPIVKNRAGTIVKRMGDGWLVEYINVSDAVACAIEIQRGLHNHKSIQLRIGVPIGDITTLDNDVYGDGVNVASRLESIAEPGQILISDTVYNSLDGKTARQFGGGEGQSLKNIARTISVWHWLQGDKPEPSAIPSTNRKIEQPEKPSVAILALENMSGDPEQEYFSDGITEDIITDLSKVSGLVVIARNSSFSYKNRALDVRQICSELNVRYVVEGSVRRAGNKVRINAQLIDGLSGGHLWADRFDRGLEDIFAVQDEITHEIVEALKVILTPTEQKHREGRNKVDPIAYECLILGRTLMYKFTAEALAKGRIEFERVISLDPGLAAQAYAGLSMLIGTEYFNGWNDIGTDGFEKALAYALKSIAENEHEASGYHAMAISHIRTGNFEEAAKAAEKAIAIDPNSAGATGILAITQDFMGRQEEAIRLFEYALRLDPKYDVALQFLGRTLFGLGRNEEAEASFRKRLTMAPQSDMARFFLASLYGLTDRIDEAKQMWRELFEVNPKFSVEHYQKMVPKKNVQWYKFLMEGLRKAGLFQ